MDEILDEIEVKNNQKKFSKLSFVMSFITFGLLYYLFSSFPKTINPREGLPEPSMIIVIAFQISCVIGLITTCLSFVRKEKSTWFKWVGGVLNILVFLLVVGVFIFVNTI